MPKIGIFPLIRVRSGTGAYLSLTEDGLPDRTTPLTRSSKTGILLNGWISQYTLSSLILLAINWVYCDPKSKIKIFSSTLI